MDKVTSGVDNRPGSSAWRWLPVLLLAILAAVVLSLWLAQRWLMPEQLAAVALSPAETVVLDQKVAALQPQRYQEDAAQRELRFSERELNALLARDPSLAGRVVIHLDQDLASATLLIPLEDEFPFIGGKTLRINAGLELRYAEQSPVVILRGVSLWGVPIPNHWLGELKHVDLVARYGVEPGFWHGLAKGVEAVEVRRGELVLKLAE